MTKDEVYLVPTAQLASAALELNFTALETAKLVAEIELARPSTKDATQLLAEQQERADLRQRESWRLAVEHQKEERTISRLTHAGLRDSLSNCARSRPSAQKTSLGSLTLLTACSRKRARARRSCSGRTPSSTARVI